MHWVNPLLQRYRCVFGAGHIETEFLKSHSYPHDLQDVDLRGC